MSRSAIAYLRPLEDRAEVASAIEASGRLNVVGVVRDGSGPRRSGLAEALEGIAACEASTLAVVRLGSVAGSLRELVAVLDWLAAAGATLVALDVDLDTHSTAGRRLVAVLQEIERWELDPAQGHRPRGRPGLAVSAPELSERIAAMRDRGLSLRAIADTLNADGVPTQRGGVQWRSSSVQAALGYRRPRPPVPGVPPPPRHPPAGPVPRAQRRPKRHRPSPPGGPRP